MDTITRSKWKHVDTITSIRVFVGLVLKICNILLLKVLKLDCEIV